MQYDLVCRPASTAVRFALEAGESITCEVGAMIAMSSGITVETTSKSRGGGGGIMKGIKRMFTGENFFLNHHYYNHKVIICFYENFAVPLKFFGKYVEFLFLF